MTRVLLLALAVCMIQAEDDEVLKRVIAAQQGITTVQGVFNQRTIRPDDEEGDARASRFVIRFEIRSPDHYSFTYTRPGDDEWRLRMCSDGKQAWTIEQFMAGEKPSVTVKGVDPENTDDLFRRIVDFFPLDEAKLRREFAVAASERNGAFTLTLKPINRNMGEQLSGITVELDKEFHTTSLTLEEPGGTRTAINVEQATYNRPIADDAFVYKAEGP